MGCITSKREDPPRYKNVWRLVHVDGKVVKKLIKEKIRG